jgi:hypothetical protein
MSSQWREDLGRICRWALLALTGGVCLAVLWSNLDLLGQFGNARDVVFVAPDKLISPQRKKTFLSLWVGSNTPWSPTATAMLGATPKRFHGIAQGRYLLVPDVEDLPPGPMSLRGVPYTQWSSLEARSRVRRIPSGKSVVLFDAQLVLQRQDLSVPPVGESFLAIAAASGQAQEISRLAKALRDQRPEWLMTIIVPEDARFLWSFKAGYLKGDLRRPGYRRMHYLTARSQAAARWAGLGVSTHFLSPTPSEPLGEKVRSWPGIDAFLVFLDSESSNR